MEYRIKDYQISGNSIVLPRETSIEDIRLVYNETQKVLICSTAKKENLSGLGVLVVNNFNNTTTINVPTSICVLNENDKLTIKCDYGDNISSVESKVEEVGNKIDNIKLPEIDTTELAKQGENQEATNSKILEEVQNKLTPLEAVLTELSHGKQEMVDALAMKNVQSSTDKTLVEIASDVRSIAQSPITIDGVEMYEKQLFGGVGDDSPFWNFYDVMTSLLNDARFFEYGGIVLCEFLKDGTSKPLAGCPLGGLYLTCDGDVYYSNTTHIWHDEENKKGNRWVALFLKEEYTNITLLTDLNPRTIHIGRKVGTIKSEIAVNVQNIICTDGNELKGIDFSNTPSFGNLVVLRNIKEHSSGKIVYNKSNVYSVYLGIDKITANPFYGNLGISSIYFDTKEYDVSSLTSSAYAGSGVNLNSLKRIYFPYGFEWKGTSTGYSGGNEIFGNAAAPNGDFHVYGITKISKGSLIHSIHQTPLVESIYVHDLEESSNGGVFSSNGGGNYKLPNLQRIVMPKLKRGNPIGSLDSSKDRGRNLIDIEVGEMETSMSYNWWMPTNVLADADKTAQLLSNIHNHIADRVKDVKGLEPLTITFSQAVRDVLLPETEELFAAKNWNIAPAKSV